MGFETDVSKWSSRKMKRTLKPQNYCSQEIHVNFVVVEGLYRGYYTPT